MYPNRNEAENDELDLALREMYQQNVPPSFENGWLQAIQREERIQMSKKSVWKWKGWTHVVIPVAAALVLVLGADWAGSLNFNASKAPSGVDSAKPTAFYSRSSTASYKDSAMDYGAAEPEVMEDSAMGINVALSNGTAKQAAQTDQRKLVRTVTLSMRTGNYEQDVAAIQQLVAEFGGYEEYHYESGDKASGDARYVEMTLRIPSDQLDSFLGGVGSIGRIVNRSENTVDRTTEYSDNEARLNTLRTKMTRLNELLAKAETVEDILAIENQISDTQYEMDLMTGWQLGIDRQVDMSTVSLTLREEKPTEITPEMTFGEKLSRAFKASWEGFGEFLRDLVVFLIMAIPAIVLIALVVTVVVLIRKAAKKRSKKAEDAPEVDEE